MSESIPFVEKVYLCGRCDGRLIEFLDHRPGHADHLHFRCKQCRSHGVCISTSIIVGGAKFATKIGGAA